MNLTESAARYGVSTLAEGRAVPQSTLRAVIDACQTGTEARSAPAAVVTRQGRDSVIRVGPAPSGTTVTAAVTLEGGDVRTLTTALDGEDVAIRVPAGLPAGYHDVDVVAGEMSSRVLLIVAPDVLETPERIGSRRLWGYDFVPGSVRSDLSWGVGDFADMAEFAGIAASQGASFLAATPLHAPAPATPTEASPYVPSTREFLNPLLIRVEDIREVAYMPAATRALIDWEAADQRAADTSASPVDLEEAWEAKKNALSLVFAHPRSPARQASLEKFVRRGGPALDSFCRWCAACEYFGPDDAKWPAVVRSGSTDDGAWDDAFADNETLDDFRRHAGRRREFYAWLQWIADGQLTAAADAARMPADAADGEPVGLVASTVVSASLGAADAWRYRSHLANGVRAEIGPDGGNEGSDGGSGGDLPTLTPAGLRDVAFAPVIDAVRASLRHAGGLRLDRPTELFRAWWVPDGSDRSDGAFIAMDADELIGIVVLEAQRAGAVVMTGDSAGLTDQERKQLTSRGIAVGRTVWDGATNGTLAPADTWPADAVATVRPHGLVPTSAFLSGEHLESGAADAEERRMAHEKLRSAAVATLRQSKLIDPGSTEREILEGLYAFAAATPARFVSVDIADAVGDRRLEAGGAPNRDWRLPLADGAGRAVTLGRFVVNPRAADLAGKLGAAR
ncbi:4-alpha-glucanotransferase [Spelaeicoccus albus]|uniref:4-alpha-glucanotransferase n=1 Tax=Spelaeicoccus albus TaxID=1280376 RepID=A0A7Z0IJ13_9MICO|nr:4-alpha-glucanotransferase [Spelaeicoccus albus]